MWQKGKYIVGDIANPLTGLGTISAVVFPEHVGHADIAKVFTPDTIIGAGFFFINMKTEVQVFDKSIGLKVESRPEDVLFIEKALGLYKE
jgi:hypothetical protein